jgi:hypothetical protein
VAAAFLVQQAGFASNALASTSLALAVRRIRALAEKRAMGVAVLFGGTELETKEKLRPREHRFARVRAALRREIDVLRSDIAKGRRPFRSDLRMEMAALLRSITLRFAAMLTVSVAVTVSVILTAMRLWLYARCRATNASSPASILLSRIYTLRNQLIHGGATWGSSVNRDQVRDCVGFMGKLVPLVIEVMLDHPETLWGDACYPVVE